MINRIELLWLLDHLSYFGGYLIATTKSVRENLTSHCFPKKGSDQIETCQLQVSGEYNLLPHQEAVKYHFHNFHSHYQLVVHFSIDDCLT